MSPAERYAYLKQMHAQYKDGLLQAAPEVFRHVATRYPSRFGTYTRFRQFFDSLPVAASESQRFFTFADARNCSILGAPWIDMETTGNKATRINRLERDYREGHLQYRLLSSLRGADWRILTTDPAMAETVAKHALTKCPRSRDGVFTVHVPGRPIDMIFEQVIELLLKFHGDYLVSRLMAQQQLNEQVQRLAELPALQAMDSQDAWL